MMSKDLNMKVNVLPVTTYNFLHVNDGRLEIKDVELQKIASSNKAGIPSGVTLKENVSFDEAGEIFRENKERILALKEEMVSPNCETAKRDESQSIRTGMGADVDKLFLENNISCDVYTVEKNVKVAEPIVLRQDLEDGATGMSSQVIHAKKGSEVTVIMAYSSERSASGFLGVSTRLLADEDATINLVKVQLLGDGYVHFDDIGGACLRGGKINLTTLELGGKEAFNGAYINLSEKEAALSSNLGYLSRDDHSLDMNYVADQRGKKTEASMQFKGVLMGTAKKTLRDTLDFKTGSSGSVGDEQEDALLLSENVVNRTMPIILCQEEDVEGRHGATIGQLGEDLLFYMQTRGIDEEEAKRIMIKARLESVARLIPDQEIRQLAIYYIQQIV
ncbi:MAG: SufD family Fe-S cluster assembly protein [Butyrivibrio sp.]|nr:SufD family Fe-S cluster assembly protein [Butyrivibrio sp.]